MKLKDKVKLYLVEREKADKDEIDIRDRLAPDLKRGEREVDGKVMYSAAWIDGDGNRHEFGGRS